MQTLQPGIFALGTGAHHHLFATVDRIDDLAVALQRVLALATTIRGVNVVVGLSPALARQLDSALVAPDLDDFVALEANGVQIPAGQHDLWVWLHGSSTSSCFDAAADVTAALHGCASVAEEQQGFAYRENRDLSGFEDGTENPPLHEAVALLTNSDQTAPVALVQQWLHDLRSFQQLSEPDREAVIGRTLATSVEIDAAHQSERAHVSRVVVEDDGGDELEIFRRSVPFGDSTEHGLLFVGFSPEHHRLTRMLERMTGADDGITDHLTEFSRCTTSGWYVVPTLEMLRAVSEPD